MMKLKPFPMNYSTPWEYLLLLQHQTQGRSVLMILKVSTYVETDPDGSRC